MRLSFVVLASLLAIGGCKQVGTVCSNSGDTSGCASDHICTFTRSPLPFDPNQEPPPPLTVCLRTCNQSSDCGEGELCQLVYCSETLSCQTGPVQDPPPNICEWQGTGGTGTGGVGGGTGGVGGGTGGVGGGEPLNCDSEAFAYIQTLDPGSGFIRTNFVPFDTTNLPFEWDRYSISLDLTDPLLANQIVQVGFSATASNFTPSGVFYDNVLVETVVGEQRQTEYDQDFESLIQESPNALAEDGWIVFANVFGEDGEPPPIYNYGPNPAPNNSGGFSGIVLDQGGDAQGTQQLVIISDYNNADQETGNRIEANTFRERTITPAEIGVTLVFSFDAIRGNINEGCPVGGMGGMGGDGGMSGVGGTGGTGGMGGAGGGAVGTGGMSGAGGS